MSQAMSWVERAREATADSSITESVSTSDYMEYSLMRQYNQRGRAK